MDKLRFIFSRTNLMQASTLKALVGFVLSLGVFHLSPDQQLQAQSLVMTLIAKLCDVIAAGQAAYAFINLVHDEHKVVIAVNAPPTTIITTPKEGPTP